jgi:Spy/CpxP family protein refolding chaperone
MKSPTVAWIIAAFALGCAAATTAQQVVVPSARAADAATWQYKCTTYKQGLTAARLAENNESEFNAHGAEGWELVGQVAPTMVCFKRAGA